MTRKDFQLIADTERALLEACRTDVERSATIKSILYIADQLATTNPRFDRVKFLAACGVSE